MINDADILAHLEEFGVGSVPIFVLRGRKAFVYLHLPKTQACGEKVYSVVLKLRDASGHLVERVTTHTRSLFLQDVDFVVREGTEASGRLGVISSGVKNVHAGCRGTIITAEAVCDVTPVTYDPKKHETFVERDTLNPIHEAGYVYMGPKGVDRVGWAGTMAEVRYQAMKEKQTCS